MKSLSKLIFGTVLGAVVILGVAATSQPEVQKWEYLQIGISKKTSKVVLVDPQGREPAARPPVLSAARVLNFYGEQGWDLLYEVERGTRILLTFKRPK